MTEPIQWRIFIYRKQCYFYDHTIWRTNTMFYLKVALRIAGLQYYGFDFHEL